MKTFCRKHSWRLHGCLSKIRTYYTWYAGPFVFLRAVEFLSVCQTHLSSCFYGKRLNFISLKPPPGKQKPLNCDFYHKDCSERNLRGTRVTRTQHRACAPRRLLRICARFQNNRPPFGRIKRDKISC
ncbi:hypothetical protein AZE42_02791 [Rhizopogon vesiculosus]|uniref:Uncharacterized protein n=1 Tax=Rhizopogon vesiculosus TaxID=180088 RepID=A0A1J8PV43_9AGAM|nr:hypothetical protein AZE42_02791 [Rhizopogon vesiculosus]